MSTTTPAATRSGRAREIAIQEGRSAFGRGMQGSKIRRSALTSNARNHRTRTKAAHDVQLLARPKAGYYGRCEKDSRAAALHPPPGRGCADLDRPARTIRSGRGRQAHLGDRRDRPDRSVRVRAYRQRHHLVQVGADQRGGPSHASSAWARGTWSAHGWAALPITVGRFSRHRADSEGVGQARRVS